MEPAPWKLGNPLLAVSPWSSSTWFLALAPLGHGLQVLAMIALLIAATQVDSVGAPGRQISVAPSYVRWSAVNIVRLSLHVILESWLVYRHARRVPPEWRLGDLEDMLAMGDLARRPANAEDTEPGPHPDPSTNQPLLPSSDNEPAAGLAHAAGEKQTQEKSVEGEKLSDEEMAEKEKSEDEKTEEKPPSSAPVPTRTLTGSSTDAVPILNSSTSVGSAPAHSVPLSTTAASAASRPTSPGTSTRSRRLAARERLGETPKTDETEAVASAERILEQPPAQIASLTGEAPAREMFADVGNTERLRYFEHLASNLDLWVCTWGFVMWVVGLVIAFPVEPVASHQPLVFACVTVGMLSNWFTALGFATCLVLWSLGYVLVIIAWVLWHLGILRGAQPELFPRMSAKKLPQAELDKCPLVIYAADPDEDEPEWGETPGCPLPLAEIDQARLPHPLRVLGQNKATCGICHTEFLPPCAKEGQEEYELEILRELPCRHTFHRECVDEWLLKHADTCPYCTQSVPKMLKDPAMAQVASAASEDGSTAEGQREPVGLAELRRTMSRRRSQRSNRTVRSTKSTRSLESIKSAANAERSAGEGSGTTKVQAEGKDDGSSSSQGSDEFHDSREVATPDIPGASRAPSRGTLSTAYETAASSLALASLRTATPVRADTPVAPIARSPLGRAEQSAVDEKETEGKATAETERKA